MPGKVNLPLEPSRWATARARRERRVEDAAFTAGRLLHGHGARRAALATAVALAFAVPFGMNALRGGEVAPAAATATKAPAVAGVPAPAALRRVTALPAPPRAERRRKPHATGHPTKAATIAPAPVTAAAPAPVSAPAPVQAPAPAPKTFDSSG
jgi:hypothetical protein